MRTVVIIGAGFGGLQCAKALANRPVQVVVLDRNNYHLFTPLLYQVASSLLNPSDIAYPVRSVFRGMSNVRFRRATVSRVDSGRRLVQTTSGPDEPYDDLVIATGAGINFFGLDDVRRSAYHLTDLRGALALRNHVLMCFERAAVTEDVDRRRALLTFAIVGAGPTGVEYAGALAELVRLIAGRDYPQIRRDAVHIALLEGGDRVLPAFPEASGRHAVERLTGLGVDVRVGLQVRAMDGTAVRFADGSALDAATLVWAAGVRPRLVRTVDDLPTTVSGRIVVDEFLRVPGVDGVHAIGDVAACMQDGRELPMLSAPAMQQGRHVADNIVRGAGGKAPRPFRYQDKGIMATIGRNAAVAHTFGITLKGFTGWIAWLVVHLYYIIGFRNRVAVLLRWAWNYVFYDRPIRFVYRVAGREEDTS